MQIITAAVIKGGTGKTTTAAALAQAAIKAGKKVLAIDLDPQANFTYFIGADQNRPGCLPAFTWSNGRGFNTRDGAGNRRNSRKPRPCDRKNSTCKRKETARGIRADKG